MKTSKVKSVCESKGEIHIIDIEIDVSRGLFDFKIIGNTDKTIAESRFRILAAIRNNSFDTPSRKNYKVTASYLPIDIPKNGSWSELALAVAYLHASNQTYFRSLNDICCIGNISIEGNIRATEINIEYLVAYAYQKGIRKFILPKHNYTVIHNLKDIEIYTLGNLSDLRLEPTTQSNKNNFYQDIFRAIHEHDLCTETHNLKLSEFILTGLHVQKRALAIAIAGNHPILFTGQPGTGKTSLANLAQYLIDDISLSEINNIYPESSSNELPTNKLKQNNKLQFSHENTFVRPVLKCTQTTTPAELFGKSNRPGLIQKVKRGILILNELCEFNKKTIENLRGYMDKSDFTDTSAADTKPLIIATTNNCPCGKKTKNPLDESYLCTCSARQVLNYQSKISEPVLDRFPIICNFQYSKNNTEEGDIAKSESIRESTLNIYNDYLDKIHKARYIARSRNNGEYNQYLSIEQILSFGIEHDASETLGSISKSLYLSKRKSIHLVRVARTIADLEGSEKINKSHIIESASHIKTKPFS